MELRGKRILVTGASGGIGGDLVRELAAAGAELVLSSRRAADLEEVAAEVRRLGNRVEIVPADLSTVEGTDALAAAALAPFGGIDVLVNNAGVTLIARHGAEGMVDKGEALLQVNLHAPLRLTARLLPPMAARGEGAVVFLSSIAAWAPFPAGAYYAASKAGLARAAETIRIEQKATGVRVLAVYPGPVQTAMLEEELRTEEGRDFFRSLPVGSSEELARRIVEALALDAEEVVYPDLYRASLWFPGLARWVVGLLAPGKKKD